MPRVKEFSKEYVMERAMLAFWKKGFSNTSIDDLMRDMEMSRQSIYDSFGKKYDIFLQSMDYYVVGLKERVLNHLAKPDSNLNDLKQHLISLLDLYQDDPGFKSCYFCNITLELGDSDPIALSKILLANKLSIEAFRKTLKNAIYKGEIKKEINVEIISDTIFTFLQGLSTLSKSGAKKIELRKQIDLIFEMIDKVYRV